MEEEYAAETLYNYPKAKRYIDFREMLENEDQIDAVVVATPDNYTCHQKGPRSRPPQMVGIYRHTR